MTRSSPSRGGGLFRRIFATFVVTVVVSAVVSAVGAYAFATRFSTDWVADTMVVVDEHRDSLAAELDDPAALQDRLDAVSATLGSRVAIYGRRGHVVAGDGPPRLPEGLRARRRELRSGHPVVFREGRLRGPGLAVGLFQGERRRPTALLVIFPGGRPRLGLPLVSLALVLAVLGGGAWILSRSLAQRLHHLETSAGRIARGELRHRVAVPPAPVDEIDEVGLAFNEMAAKVEALLHGQKTLLANVSHELRTPIARIKVLLELLQERVDASDPSEDPRLPRVRRGLVEMGEDVVEIETLISDLLTSGRLELREDAGASLQSEAVDLPALMDKVAAKFGAEIEGEPAPTLVADALLLERLLSNLLANARRACPEGRLTIGARDVGDGLCELHVTDEGPGVPAADRETIFEPFRRLDAARDRDRGGVGLGLYLCRQVCAAHGGTIAVHERPDGRPGAHFVVRLPSAGPDPGPAAARGDA